MKAERWAQVDRLLDEALAFPPEARAGFLAQASGGDEELRREVAALLAAHERAAGAFLQAPAPEVSAGQMAGGSTASLIGREVGPYQILALLGVGGMGEVYLAQDGRLKRRLALKLLPRQFVADAARVERFAREARAVSALNHPNIVTVYDIGEAATEFGGTHYIAMEYVEGQTLREQCQAGLLNAKDAVEIVIQIAAALSAAHEAGIVHRDIKPENVMLRHDGYVKVLDFGLAKLTEQQRLTGETHASGSDRAKTNPGAVLGTVRYMSPEQALGEEVDRRSDIFSLGVLLYELVTGVSPFKGPSTASLLDAIVHHQPLPLTQVRNDLPAELERIVNRMLEKDRDLRYQTAGDLRAVLKRLRRELDSSPSQILSSSHSGQATTLPRKGRRRAWLALAAVMALAVTVGAWWLATRKNVEELTWSRAVASQLTAFTGAELFPAFSPDGKDFVYARNTKDNWDIYQQRMNGSVPRNLTPDSPYDDTQPAYAPDGERIAFRSERSGGGIFVMGATGESARKVSSIGYYPDWSPDSKEIVFSSMFVTDPSSRGANCKLYAVNVATNQSSPPREIDAGRDAVQPRWSPQGWRIAYWAKDEAAQRDIWTVSPRGGDAVRVTNDAAVDWNPVWSPDGKFIYFISNRKGAPSLWRVPVDEASGRALGEPEPIIGPLAQSWQLNISHDGRRLVYVKKDESENLYAINFDPNRFEKIDDPIPILEGTKHSSGPDVSPDGQWLTYYSRGETNEDIFVSKTDGTAPNQLTNDAFPDRMPRWTPDGKRILFFSKASGRYEIWAVNADGSGRQRLSFNNGQPSGVTKGGSLVYPLLSPDRRWISYCIAGGETFLLDASKSWQEQQPQALPFIKPGEEWFIAWSWSLDSKKLAGWASNRDSEYPGTYIYSLDTQQFEKIAAIGQRQYWLSDNRHLICVEGGKIFLLDSQMKDKPRLLLEMPRREIRSASISVDRRRIYFSLVTEESDIRLLTLE